MYQKLRLCYSHSICPNHILQDNTIMGRSNRDKIQSPVGCLSMKGIPATVGGSLNWSLMHTKWITSWQQLIPEILWSCNGQQKDFIIWVTNKYLYKAEHFKCAKHNHRTKLCRECPLKFWTCSKLSAAWKEPRFDHHILANIAKWKRE